MAWMSFDTADELEEVLHLYETSAIAWSDFDLGLLHQHWTIDPIAAQGTASTAYEKQAIMAVSWRQCCDQSC
jgi:hypothetical protein